MQSGDEVLAIDGLEIDAPSDLVLAVRQAPGRTLPLEVRRGDAVLSFQVTPDEASGERLYRSHRCGPCRRTRAGGRVDVR